MTDEKTTGGTPTSGQWTSAQAYMLSVICLLVGVAVGYLVRGSAPPAMNAQPQPAGMTNSAAAQPQQQPTPEQLRQMAETQAQPLLAQLKTDPNNAALLYQIGNLYYDAQQYPDAVKYYQDALRINPKETNVRTDLGTAYHLMGQPDQAIKEYDEVLKVDSKHANALFNEGMVKWQDKMDMSGAVADWKRLLETNPDFPQRERVQQMIAQVQQHQAVKPGGAPGSN